jgi:GH25 family lysozyme M1 (1,4-beta-N-acetylmuramidase)
MIVGIDTASVAGNKNVNWTAAKAAGITFAVLRSNYGNQTDTAFKREWDRVAAAGITRGAYLYLRHPKISGKNKGPAPDPESQAKAMLDTVGDLDASDFPPVVDVEFSGDGRKETGLTAEECLERVRVAVRVLRAFYGVAPILYTSARVWKEDLNNLAAPDLADCPLWLARYNFKKGPAVRDPKPFAGNKLDPPVPPPWGDGGNWWMHQYQGDATGCPGFPVGNVDMNRFNSMYKGAVGARVKWVQKRLKIAETGKFDDTMVTAVVNLQKTSGLVADGVIGPRTFTRLAWMSV